LLLALLPARARERRLRFERRDVTTGWPGAVVDDGSEWLGEDDGIAVAALVVVSSVVRGESGTWSSVCRDSAITAYVRMGAETHRLGGAGAGRTQE
jgi:hypothetical protein